MTPGKDAMPAEERALVLQRIAKVAKRQGNWQLAAKKYTQVGRWGRLGRRTSEASSGCCPPGWPV